MDVVRTTLRSLAAICVCAACAKTDSAPPTSEEAVMPNALAVQVAMVSNYGFMGQMFSKGDGRNYSLFYADTGTLVREGMAPLRGREAISEFAHRGADWGVVEIRRLSDGSRVEGRDVHDSGTYVVLSGRPIEPNTVPPGGHYRTHWRYTAKGDWLIISDSLFAMQKKK